MDGTGAGGDGVLYALTSTGNLLLDPVVCPPEAFFQGGVGPQQDGEDGREAGAVRPSGIVNLDLTV